MSDNISSRELRKLLEVAGRSPPQSDTTRPQANPFLRDYYLKFEAPQDRVVVSSPPPSEPQSDAEIHEPQHPEDVRVRRGIPEDSDRPYGYEVMFAELDQRNEELRLRQARGAQQLHAEEAYRQYMLNILNCDYTEKEPTDPGDDGDGICEGEDSEIIYDDDDLFEEYDEGLFEEGNDSEIIEDDDGQFEEDDGSIEASNDVGDSNVTCRSGDGSGREEGELEEGEIWEGGEDDGNYVAPKGDVNSGIAQGNGDTETHEEAGLGDEDSYHGATNYDTNNSSSVHHGDGGDAPCSGSSRSSSPTSDANPSNSAHSYGAAFYSSSSAEPRTPAPVSVASRRTSLVPSKHPADGDAEYFSPRTASGGDPDSHKRWRLHSENETSAGQGKGKGKGKYVRKHKREVVRQADKPADPAPEHGNGDEGSALNN